MNTTRLWKDCDKHGRTFALPVIDGKILGREEWPDSQQELESFPRICAKCLAEAMVSPIRRAA